MSNTWLDLKGKVAIVTGGNSGIGKAIAVGLESANASVVIADLNVDSVSDNKLSVKTNITKISDINNLVSETIKKYGKIDILVNCAGVCLPRLLFDKDGKKEYEIDEENFDRTIGVNLKGLVFTTQAVVREMYKKQSGVIINISSSSSIDGSIGQSIYAASKSAMNNFTKSWAKELSKFGIRVVGIAPGIVEETGLTNAKYNEALGHIRGLGSDGVNQNYINSIPLQRVGKLSEIADLAVFLASERASYITGNTVFITGGKVMN